MVRIAATDGTLAIDVGDEADNIAVHLNDLMHATTTTLEKHIEKDRIEVIRHCNKHHGIARSIDAVVCGRILIVAMSKRKRRRLPGPTTSLQKLFSLPPMKWPDSTTLLP